MTTAKNPPPDGERKVVPGILGTAGARAADKMGAAMLREAVDVTPSAAVDPYAYRWRELRRRQARVLCAAAACLTLSVLGAFLLPSNITRFGVIMVAVAIMVPFVFALNSYPCPRCKKPFFARSDEDPLNYYLAKKCVHCELVIGTSKADAVVARDEPEIQIIP